MVSNADSSNPVVIALITCGRIAPSFGPAVGGFVSRYRDILGDRFLGKKNAVDDNGAVNGGVQLIAYRHGYRGILRGDSLLLGDDEAEAAELFSQKGGSPIGASRTRLTNLHHLRMRGLVKDGEDPHEIAAQQLLKDKVRVLHVVGSADAQITAQRLSSLLSMKYHYVLHVVGLAKTIENDMSPIQMTLGAQTAAQQGAIFFENVVAENNSNPRMLIIHEIKGRAAGWLAASTASAYRHRLDSKRFASSFGQPREVFDVHAVYTPETPIDFDTEVPRLKRCMDRNDNVNVFVAQGTALPIIEAEMTAEGKVLSKHPHLGYTVIDTAAWLSRKLKDGIGAHKVLIQRSGIYVRAAPACIEDLRLTQSCVNFAVDRVVNRILGNPTSTAVVRGVVGHDDRWAGELRLVEIEALMRKKPFDVSTPWFVRLLASIGQPQESAGRLRWRVEQEKREKQKKHSKL